MTKRTNNDLQENFEETKGAARSYKPKNYRQCNDQKNKQRYTKHYIET